MRHITRMEGRQAGRQEAEFFAHPSMHPSLSLSLSSSRDLMNQIRHSTAWAEISRHSDQQASIYASLYGKTKQRGMGEADGTVYPSLFSSHPRR